MTGRVGDVLNGRALRWQVCSDGSTLTTPAGTVHLRARATAEFAPAQLDLLGPVRRAARPPDRDPARSADRRAGRRAAAAALELDDPRRSPELPRRWEATTTDGTHDSGAGQRLAAGLGRPRGAATTVVASFAPDVPYQLALLVPSCC